MRTYEDELIDQLLTAMLWSRRAANTARTCLHISAFAARAALAALIDDHDRNHAPDDPLDGTERVRSIAASIINRATDAQRARREHDDWILGKRSGPEPVNPYRCPVASMTAYHGGVPDLYLLARARDVLTYLPLLVAPAHPESPDANVAHLARQLIGLQA